MPTTYVPLGGVHDTLMVLIPELDRLLRDWPLNTESRTCRMLARAATRSLNDVDVYATLLAGPPAWRRSPVGADCKVERLVVHLRDTLERALAADLSQMLQKWSDWDVRHFENAGRKPRTGRPRSKRNGGRRSGHTPRQQRRLARSGSLRLRTSIEPRSSRATTNRRDALRRRGRSPLGLMGLGLRPPT